MNITHLIAAVLALAGTVLSFFKYVHIFQLNSYKMPEQLKWTRTNPGRLLPHWIAAILAVIALLTHRLPFLIAEAVLLALFLPAVRPPKKAKKPLVMTPRVIRLTVTAMLLALVIWQFSFTAPERIRYCFPALNFCLAPLLPVAANFLNQPAEKGIQNGFIRDAQRMLRESPNLTVIGITGSYGKTSVKYFLHTLLKSHFDVLMTPGSFNTPMGVVRTVREQLRPTHEIFLCEMGARRAGEIKELCDIAEPTYGILTSIGPQHLETFRTIETIIETKFALADAVEAAGKGVCFVNCDNELIRNNLGSRTRTVAYGMQPGCAYWADNLRVTHEGTAFDLHCPDGTVLENLQTSLIGAHNAVNLAGAIGMALHLGVTEQEIRIQLRKLAAPPHRLELKRSGNAVIIDDAYNSNPSGSKAALDALAMFPDCKILITPGMVELGEQQDELNAAFGRQAAAVCDYIFLVGEKQAVPIRRGIEEAGFDMSRVTVTHTVDEAIAQAYAVKTQQRRVILLENDLPDNYL
ncbi:MAG: UDP-N-acetylmuramoyl-tripeptide--D-alanyl-D-alanine ligase [Oscillospiraceae bacterium]|nr:UDP-N-acetylmuramoyl-tripeptide--D-alanyl-D-alanine ligase [Oscillospiraceae bacterium]